MPFTLSVSVPGGGSLAMEGQAGPLNATDSTNSPLDAKLTLKHVDLGALGFIDTSSGVGGLVDFDGQVKSDGHRLHSEGKANATNLRLVKGGQPAKQAVALDYKSDYALDSQTGTVNANLHTGNSLTNANGTLNAKGEDVLANLKIEGKNMAVNDVEGLLPAFRRDFALRSVLAGRQRQYGPGSRRPAGSFGSYRAAQYYGNTPVWL